MAKLTKICTKCKEDLPLGKFSTYKSKDNKLGYRIRSACRECLNKQNSARWREQPEKMRAIQAKYRAAHREEVLERQRRCAKRAYDANPEKNKAEVKARQKANPERSRAYRRITGHRRRANKAANGGMPGTVPAWLVSKILDIFHGLCVYCLGKNATELDHVVPLSKGGKNSVDNLLPACKSCNSSKGTKDPEAFAQSMGITDLQALLVTAQKKLSEPS